MYIGWFTHISGGHPSATGRAQDRESSPAKDQRSTTVPRVTHPTVVYFPLIGKYSQVTTSLVPITTDRQLESPPDTSAVTDADEPPKVTATAGKWYIR